MKLYTLTLLTMPRRTADLRLRQWVLKEAFPLYTVEDDD